jgi:hypothetical protein
VNLGGDIESRNEDARSGVVCMRSGMESGVVVCMWKRVMCLWY